MEILETGEKLPGEEYDYREVCFGIVERDGKFLVVFSAKDRNVSLPGGGIEKGETPEQAIYREFLEEAGYKVKSAEEVVRVHSYWNFQTGKRVERFAYIFAVEVAEESKMTPIENWHTRLWVETADANNVIPFPYQKAGIEYYLSNFKR